MTIAEAKHATAEDRRAECGCELCAMRRASEELEAELVRVRKQRDEARAEIERLKRGP